MINVQNKEQANAESSSWKHRIKARRLFWILSVFIDIILFAWSVASGMTGCWTNLVASRRMTNHRKSRIALWSIRVRSRYKRWRRPCRCRPRRSWIKCSSSLSTSSIWPKPIDKRFWHFQLIKSGRYIVPEKVMARWTTEACAPLTLVAIRRTISIDWRL